MIPTQKLIDTLWVEEFLHGNSLGIFGYIHDVDDEDNPNFPWLTENFAHYIDTEYYFHHSGDKRISKYFHKMLEYADVGTIGDAEVMMAQTIINKFSDKWKKLYSAFIESNYKPLENYDMKEKETPNLTRTKNVKMKTETANDVYGFNSESSVPQSKTTNSGDKLDNEEEEKNTGTRDLERHGNIGVTTSQQMLQSEIDLRKSFNFINEIMDDVDSILCLLVY